MATSLSACARVLTAAGIRHHLDTDEAAIRVVFVTRRYVNGRGEKLVIVKLEPLDDGRRLRASIARAFPAGDDPASMAIVLCRLAAGTPLVAAEFDEDRDGWRLVTDVAVEDGRLTARQVCSMLDHLVEAAEAWHVALRADPLVRTGLARSRHGRVA